jgi:retron-type reverse transcriptase
MVKKFVGTNKGILQGSSLSPLLFDIYIDPLLRKLSSGGCFVRAFADDVVFILDDWKFLDGKLEVIQEWSNEFGIKVNPRKSGVMRLLRRAG